MNSDIVIRSRDNPRIKRLASLLTQKKQRDESGMFVLEGARLCLDAFEAGISFDELLITQEAASRYPKLLYITEACRTSWMDENLSARIGDTQSPQGVFAVIPKPYCGKDAVKIREDGRYIILAGLQDPGNLGAILRTASALGSDGVLLSGCPDICSPKVVRAAMGALWRLPIAQFDAAADMIKTVRANGLVMWAACLSDNAVPLSQADFGKGSAVLIGNEGHGLPKELIVQCERSVIIPMKSGVDSLGAGAAAAILIWEICNDAR